MKAKEYLAKLKTDLGPDSEGSRYEEMLSLLETVVTDVWLTEDQEHFVELVVNKAAHHKNGVSVAEAVLPIATFINSCCCP